MEEKTILSVSIENVNAEIEKKRKELEEAVKLGDDLVMVEGETYTGFPASVMVEPNKVVPICLEYDLPMYSVLEEDYPQGMWDDLAQLLGLEYVYSIDL